MTVNVLVCKPDGTQSFESRELPDNWFDTASEVEEEKTEE